MKTLTVIGVSQEGGFGNFLADSLSDEFAVTRHSREDREWKLDSDVVVLTMFDRKRPLLQSIELGRIFKKVKDTDTTVVTIGSTIHYVDRHQDGYAQGKCIVHKLFYDLAFNTGEYQCKMVLIEPGSLDNRYGNPERNYHLKQAELVKVLRGALALEQKFLHLAVRGDNPPQGEHA